MSKRKQRQSNNKQKIKEQRAVKQIEPRTDNQKLYLDTIDKSQYTIAVGPAGTGKTMLALWKALRYYEDGLIDKIVIVRPMTEARVFGEKAGALGAMPGGIFEKLYSWVLSIFDNADLVIDKHFLEQLIYNEVIEFSPLALIRGRSLNRCMVLGEEIQNITFEDGGLKMLLTRLGEGSKMILSGDLDQKDIPLNKKSALEDALTRFKDTEGFSIVKFDKKDIQRNKLISKILDKYQEK